MRRGASGLEESGKWAEVGFTVEQPGLTLNEKLQLVEADLSISVFRKRLISVKIFFPSKRLSVLTSRFSDYLLKKQCVLWGIVHSFRMSVLYQMSLLCLNSEGPALPRGQSKRKLGCRIWLSGFESLLIWRITSLLMPVFSHVNVHIIYFIFCCENKIRCWNILYIFTQICSSSFFPIQDKYALKYYQIALFYAINHLLQAKPENQATFFFFFK